MNFSNITISVLAAFLLCLMMPAGTQAQNFEGVVQYKIPGSSATQTNEIAYMIKGKQVRMEMGQGQNAVAIIYQPENDETIVLVNRMQAYMKMNKGNTETDNKADNQPTEPEIEQTGKTKTIAGYSCEIWNVETETGDAFSMCMNRELGKFITPQNPMSNRQGPIWAQITDPGPAFPLEVKTIGDDEQVLLLATQIEEKKLAPSLFEIPKNYRDMSDLMKQLQNRN